MKLHWNRYPIRWFTAVIVAIGFISAYVGQSVVPLLITLIAILFLAATLTNKIQPPQNVFVSRLGLAILASAISVAALNYVVNPFGLYPPHLFEPLVLTTRDYKMNLYRAYSPPPQAVVMGSSRSFTVDPNQIEGLWHDSAFNFSVTVGTIRDALALLHYISEVGKPPDLLILNVAPEAFVWGDDKRYNVEPNARLWDWVDSQDPLFSLKDSIYRLTRLFSKEQVEASFRVLQVTGSKQAGLPNFITDHNGMIRSTGNRPTAEELIPENVYNSRTVFFGTLFDKYHPHFFRADVLQQILEIAKQQHILVIGYMPPYHPAMRGALETRTAFNANLTSVTSQLDTFEKDYPFHYLNFIDAPIFSNNTELFFDLIHPNIEASSIMMQQLYDQFHHYAKSS